jgi:hypothetical protein
MATIKLGMLVTQIAGSIGGTTFRRGASFTCMQNKQKGASKSKLLINTALIQLSNVSRQWSALDSSVITDWNNASLLFQFPDKFGDLKNLSGRQLFIKLTNFNANAGLPAPDPTELSSTVEDVTMISQVIAIGGFVKSYFSAGAIGELVAMQCVLLRNVNASPTFTRNKITVFKEIDGDNEIEFETEFFAQYPNALNGETYRTYYTPQNIYGFKGLTKYFDTIVTTAE